jgi:glycosyltransferase involved in cell wall biosynthesis
LVSVIIPTYNRRRYLGEALASAVAQTYRHLEIFVVRDGGEDVADIVGAIDDPRVIFINRDENRGKPYSLNEALVRAKGEYVAYLDDDDMYYPQHVGVLVEALEHRTDCQVAYSDLYKTYCQVTPAGRVVLSKQLEISRDFDRFLMLYFNHVLHVSLMHRRDLLERTGVYNERLNILIDWDMTRRLAFFSDFHHVHTITGEFFSPIGESDRISCQRRKDKKEYLRNVLAIRTTRPRQPWTKIEDLAIVLLVEHVDQRLAETMLKIWKHTFYPYTLYLPLPPAQAARLDTSMPNVAVVPVDVRDSWAERIDTVLRQGTEPYVAVAPPTLDIDDMWVENPLYPLISSREREGFLLEGATPEAWAGVVRRGDLEAARAAFPHLSTEASLTAAGVRARPPEGRELPFLFDEALRQAMLAEADGNWATAAHAFERMAVHFQNELWMKAMAARAHFEAGHHDTAGQLSAEVNQSRPTVDTLLLEARIRQKQQDWSNAIRLLCQAEQWLKGDCCSPVCHRRDLCST